VVNGRRVAVILVDHGSRRQVSNALLDEVARLYAERSGREIVEPAHMELAGPSLATALDRCVARGAELVVVHPYFLLPGRHADDDIPRLAAEAATRHPGVEVRVTAPLGLHPSLADVIEARVAEVIGT
jgi:sirohydrochlorin ferrochelatase